MSPSDLQFLSTFFGTYRIKYDQLSAWFGTAIPMKNLFMVFDISEVLKKVTEMKELFVDKKNVDFHVGVEIMNVLAHYSKYFKNRQAASIKFIVFVRTNEVYDEYCGIISMLGRMADYFPKVCIVPRIIKDNECYVHAVGAYIECLKDMMKDYDTLLLTLGRSTINNQLFFQDKVSSCSGNIFKDAHKGMTPCYVPVKDIYERMFKTQDHLARFKGTRFKAELKSLYIPLGRYLNTINIKDNEFKLAQRALKTRSVQLVEKFNRLDWFLNNTYDPNLQSNINAQFVEFALEDVYGYDEKASYRKYCYKYDYRLQDLGRLKAIVNETVRARTVRLKDYSILRNSEKYKLLVNHDLDVMSLS